MLLKVLSWNIWIDGYFDQVTRFLEASKADVIGLQEVLSDDPGRDVIGFLDTLGYQYVFAPVRHTGSGRVFNDGPAVFSKHKIGEAETYILSEKNKRAAVRADILVGGKKLHVFSTHLMHTHQELSEEQEEQAENLLGRLPAKHTIVMGDFNAIPESGAIKLIRNVLIDSDRNSQPTWSVYPEGCLVCNPGEVNIRLDYIFTTDDIKTRDFKVEKSKASDHLPISVVVEI